MELLNVDSIRQNKSKTILTFSVPAIISMVLSSFVSIADGFFMGNYIHQDAIAAVNLGLPIIYLFLAVGLMVGVGGSVISAIELGAKNLSKAKRAFNQTMVTTVVVSMLLTFFTFFMLKPMLYILGAEGKVAEYFLRYYSILLFELPLMLINSVLGMFLRDEGKPVFSMNINLLTVLMNIALDGIFVVFFHMGVEGIAWASVISALTGTIILLLFFAKGARIFRFGKFSFDREILRNTVANGASEGIGELSMLISMSCYNYVIMKKFGVDGVTAFTIVGYVSYVFSMIVVGFCQGSGTIISICFGSKEKALARSIRKRTNAFVLAIAALVCLALAIGSGTYASFFVKDNVLVKMISRGLLIFMPSFFASGINSIASAYFTSEGKAKESAVISSLRGLVLLLAAIFILPAILGLTGIWLTSPVAEGLTLLVSLMFIAKDNRS